MIMSWLWTLATIRGSFGHYTRIASQVSLFLCFLSLAQALFLCSSDLSTEHPHSTSVLCVSLRGRVQLPTRRVAVIRTLTVGGSTRHPTVTDVLRALLARPQFLWELELFIPESDVSGQHRFATTNAARREPESIFL
jgi:hypothetical protein